MQEKKLIIGLGNPGLFYKKTRHNIGFRVLDILRKQLKAKRRRKTGSYWLYSSGDYILLKPRTYMNNTGVAVKEIVSEVYKINIKRNMIVILDDVAIPFGTIRIRESGSSGGHNGLKSVINELETSEFARLRIGILGKNNGDIHNYVLERFLRAEEKQLPHILKCSTDAVLLWANSKVEEAMNKYNSKNLINELKD